MVNFDAKWIVAVQTQIAFFIFVPQNVASRLHRRLMHCGELELNVQRERTAWSAYLSRSNTSFPALERSPWRTGHRIGDFVGRTAVPLVGSCQ